MLELVKAEKRMRDQECCSSQSVSGGGKLGFMGSIMENNEHKSCREDSEGVKVIKRLEFVLLLLISTLKPSLWNGMSLGGGQKLWVCFPCECVWKCWLEKEGEGRCKRLILNVWPKNAFSWSMGPSVKCSQLCLPNPHPADMAGLRFPAHSSARERELSAKILKLYKHPRWAQLYLI